MLMGPVKNNEFLELEDATWFEKTGILLLLIPIIGMGVAPLWLSDMILASLQPFIQGVL
jgi:NADH-quinone oxidoreductase subunit M